MLRMKKTVEMTTILMMISNIIMEGDQSGKLPQKNITVMKMMMTISICM